MLQILSLQRLKSRNKATHEQRTDAVAHDRMCPILRRPPPSRPTMTTLDHAHKPASVRQIASGAGWLMLFKMADKSVGLISTAILARVLTPADFGLVAMALAVVALTQLMGAFGFDSALIQRQDAIRKHYDTAWTFNVALGGLIAATLLLLAYPAAQFYREPRLALIIPVLAITALIGGFENIGTVAFRKELDFRSEFRFLLAKRLASFTVTLALALTFRTYWALIAGAVTGSVMSVAISYWLHDYRPKFTLAARADLFTSQSGYLFPT